MKNINNILSYINERLFSSTYQIKRIIILVVVIIGLLLVSFGSYYYYDRYQRTQPSIAQSSLSDAEKAVRDDPQNPSKRIALAEVYLLNRRYPDAITQANQVISVEPDNDRALLVVGISYASSGKPDKAIDPLTKYYNAHKDEDMAGLDRSLQSVAYYLGDSYLQLGQPDKAIEPLVKAVTWDQTDADAMYKLGLAFEGTKDYASAVDMFSKAVTFVPDFTEAYQSMADCYDAMHQPDQATYARGMVAYSKKDFKTAQSLLLKAAIAQPGFAPVFAGLGQTYEVTNDLKDAKTAYETAVKLDPNSFAATNGLQRVNSLLSK